MRFFSLLCCAFLLLFFLFVHVSVMMMICTAFLVMFSILYKVTAHACWQLTLRDENVYSIEKSQHNTNISTDKKITPQRKNTTAQKKMHS